MVQQIPWSTQNERNFVRSEGEPPNNSFAKMFHIVPSTNLPKADKLERYLTLLLLESLQSTPSFHADLTLIQCLCSYQPGPYYSFHKLPNPSPTKNQPFKAPVFVTIREKEQRPRIPGFAGDSKPTVPTTVAVHGRRVGISALLYTGWRYFCSTVA